MRAGIDQPKCLLPAPRTGFQLSTDNRRTKRSSLERMKTEARRSLPCLRGYDHGMRNERPYKLRCSIDADKPRELARVLREIASDISLPDEMELQSEGDILFEISGDRHSSWSLRLQHDADGPHAA